LQIFTVGHSTRSSEELCELLSKYQVTALADVRRFPYSSRNPQFNKEPIETALSKHGVRYLWIEKLGGRRNGIGASSKNSCWKNESFRNYADYMETEEFLEGSEELLGFARTEAAAIMCAEAVYWRCHRVMISDFLKSKGVDVTHILDAAHLKEHEYSQCARIFRGNLTYHDTQTNLDD